MNPKYTVILNQNLITQLLYIALGRINVYIDYFLAFVFLRHQTGLHENLKVGRGGSNLKKGKNTSILQTYTQKRVCVMPKSKDFSTLCHQ